MTAAWLWVKKNWKWLLLPVGVLIWLFGRLGAPRTGYLPVSSELLKHMEEKNKLDEEKHQQIEEASTKRSTDLLKLEKEHSKNVEAVHAKAQATADEVRGNPDAVNDMLLRVGKNVRNPNKPRG